MKYGIDIHPGESGQYFFGDNLEGYLEGDALLPAGGTGYWLQNQPLFREATPGWDKTSYPVCEAARITLLPFGIRHTFADGSCRQLSLLTGQRAIVLRWQGPAERFASIQLIFDAAAGSLTPFGKTDGWIWTCETHPMAVSLHSSEEIRVETTFERDEGGCLRILTLTPTRSLDLVLAFDPDPERAQTLARHLLSTHAIEQHEKKMSQHIGLSSLQTGDADVDRAIVWSKVSSGFMVSEEFGTGIWAGLPWFKNNWGRDTFIALPGTLLVSGRFEEAKEVIRNFLRYQDTDPASPTYGRVPNRVQSATDIIYNTADGTPWLIRELYEVLQFTGDLALALETYPALRLALDTALEREVDDEGFLTHDDADTWMDARIEGDTPWSPRGNRAVEIQALWHNALLVGESLAHLNQDPNSATRWREAADKLQGNFLTRFWDEQRHTLFDRLTAAGEPDTRVRPNVLMVLSVPQIAPLLSPTQAAQVVNHTVSELLFPHGIASLSPRDPDFHPYHHLEESYHFDAAYHNGTVWGWNAGFTITALCQTGQEELAYALTQNLTRQILDLGCRGGMSELVEAIPRPGEPITLSGTWAQAWSSSEFARNATQDFLGFQPRLLEQILVLSPRLPRAWTSVQARLPFGTESLEVDILQKEQFELKVKRQGGHEPAFTLSLNLWVKERSYVLTCPLPPAGEVNLAITGRTLSLNGEPMGEGIEAPHPPACSFVVPALPSPCPVLEGKDVLQRKIEAEL